MSIYFIDATGGHHHERVQRDCRAPATPGRLIINLLAGSNARTVGEVVSTIRLSQSAVSKHLGVLRTVGIVSMSKQGQHRFYQLNAKELKPVHDWVKTYERFWSRQLDRIKERAERKAVERSIKEKP